MRSEDVANGYPKNASKGEQAYIAQHALAFRDKSPGIERASAISGILDKSLVCRLQVLKQSALIFINSANL